MVPAEGRLARVSAAALFFCVAFASIPWMHDGNLPKWIALWALLGLGSAVLLIRGTKVDAIDGAAIVLVLYAAWSTTWSPDNHGAWETFQRFGSAVTAFLILRRLANESLIRWAATGGILAVLVHYAWQKVPFGGFGNPNFVTEFLLVAMPLVWWPVGIVGGLVALGASQLWGPVVVGWIAVLLYRRGDWRLAATALTLASFLGAVALNLSTNIEIALGTRVDLWIGSVAAWIHAPLFGHGIGSFRYVFPFFGDASASFGVMPYSVEMVRYAEAAHNDYLQLLFEFGLVGFALAGVLLFLILRKVTFGRGLMAVIAGAILALYGYPLQNPATAVLLIAALATFVPVPLGGRRAYGLICVLVSLGLLTGVRSAIASEAHFSIAHKWFLALEHSENDAAVNALLNINEAYKANPASFGARLLLYRVALLVYERRPAEVEPEAVEEAYRIARTASPAHTALLMARIRQLNQAGQCGPDVFSEECTATLVMLSSTASRKYFCTEFCRPLGELLRKEP